MENKSSRIIKLDISDVGKWVIYKKELENERGKILSFSNERKIAYVVYKCNANWDLDHWKDYTAEATNYEDIEFVN